MSLPTRKLRVGGFAGSAAGGALFAHQASSCSSARGESHWAQALREFEQLEATKASADGSDLIEKLKAAGRLMRAYDEAETQNIRRSRRKAASR